MTNINMNWKTEQVQDNRIEEVREPFLLSPAGKDYLWGGRRLKDDFSKKIDLTPLAETWECSTHPDGESRAASGCFAGMGLSEILSKHPSMTGSHPAVTGVEDPSGLLPVLVKFIDANKDLSVQVHPDDAYAAAHENGSRGKTEMWYVVDAAKDASIIYGFNREISKETAENALASDEIERYLQKVPVAKGDVFLIRPGTVHAVGAGCLIAEIQESSNITYRMYDYHRTDRFGKERELHIGKALDVAILKNSARPRQPMHVFRYRKGYVSEFLCRCPYFEAERVRVNTERIREMAEFRTDSRSFQIMICTDGCGVLFWNGIYAQENTAAEGSPSPDRMTGEKSLRFFRGDTIFIPADSVDIRIHGKAELLKVSC